MGNGKQSLPWGKRACISSTFHFDRKSEERITDNGEGIDGQKTRRQGGVIMKRKRQKQ